MRARAYLKPKLVVDEREKLTLGRGAFTVRGVGQFIFLSDQQFSQIMEVTAENSQRDITLETRFRRISTTLQSVARLQSTNSRFDAWVPTS